MIIHDLDQNICFTKTDIFEITKYFPSKLQKTKNQKSDLLIPGISDLDPMDPFPPKSKLRFHQNFPIHRILHLRLAEDF